MTHTPLGTDLDVQQGTTWHDGKLYFFHPHFIEVLRIWPKPAAWRKDARGGWKHVMSGQFSYDAHVSSARGVQDVVEKAAQDVGSPPDPLTVPQIVDNTRLRRRVPDWRVWQAIPQRVGACLSGLGGRAWHVLTLLARVPEAVELAESNRAVAWILASSRDFRTCAQPMRRARRLVRLPRHELLGELGRPRRRAVVRLLVKVTPDALARVADLLTLRDRCHDEDFLREAGHLKVVTRDVLQLLADERIARWATPALWREVAALPEQPRWLTRATVPQLLEQALERATDLGVALPPVTSLRHLERLHADLRGGLDRLAEEKGFARLSFGRPPLEPPDDVAMHPLRDFAELREEGEWMHHCIGSPVQRYVRAIAAGTGYAWHVQRPDATVFAERVAGRWELSEVRGFCNAAVPGWLVGRLRRWVAVAPEVSEESVRSADLPEARA